MWHDCATIVRRELRHPVNLPHDGTTTPTFRSMIYTCTLANAFVAHYNAPRFISEMDDNTIAQFDTVVSASFSIATGTFIVVASAGFLTLVQGRAQEMC